MREASFGPPSDNPDEIVWVTLHEIMDLQGPDPKKWAIKPHCPHCKVELRAYDKKGALGVRPITLEAVNEAGLRRPQIGFSHISGTAKADCPYLYINSPLFDYPESRGTASREEIENRKILYEEKMAEGLQELLRHLMAYVTHRYHISGEHQKILDCIKDEQAFVRGMAVHPWLMPFLQVTMLGPYMREENLAEVPTQTDAPTFFEATAEVVKRRRKPKLDVVWRPVGTRVLPYTSVNPEDEERDTFTPAMIELCSVHKKKKGVSYRRLLHPSSEDPTWKIPTVIEVSHDRAREIVDPYYERKKRREGQKKALRKGRLSPKKPASPSQTQMDLPEPKVA